MTFQPFVALSASLRRSSPRRSGLACTRSGAGSRVAGCPTARPWPICASPRGIRAYCSKTSRRRRSARPKRLLFLELLHTVGVALHAEDEGLRILLDHEREAADGEIAAP